MKLNRIYSYVYNSVSDAYPAKHWNPDHLTTRINLAIAEIMDARDDVTTPYEITTLAANGTYQIGNDEETKTIGRAEVIQWPAGWAPLSWDTRQKSADRITGEAETHYSGQPTWFHIYRTPAGKLILGLIPAADVPVGKTIIVSAVVGANMQYQRDEDVPIADNLETALNYLSLHHLLVGVDQRKAEYYRLLYTQAKDDVERREWLRQSASPVSLVEDVGFARKFG